MSTDLFEQFFDGDPRRNLFDAIHLSLREDGPDLTANAVFSPEETLCAEIFARNDTVLAGLPLIEIILRESLPEEESAPCVVERSARDGERVAKNTVLATVRGGARRILKSERVILNFLCHLSGIATVTAAYAGRIAGTGVALLDTRKTLPGLRYPEKYAALIGGARNHRNNLADILMLGGNHIDMGGSMTRAVARLRETYSPCAPIEVQCRNEAEVREAVACGVDWILFDTMSPGDIAAMLALVPETITTEASGGISLQNIREFAEAGGRAGLTYISVGRLTHSAPFAHCSMRMLGHGS